MFILNFETNCSSLAAVQIQWWLIGVSSQCSSSEISPEDQVCLNTGYKCMFTALLSLFSPAWDSMKFTLRICFICPFVVIDPANLVATIVFAQALHLTIFNLSLTHIRPQAHYTCLFTNGNKVCLWVEDVSYVGKDIQLDAVAALPQPLSKHEQRQWTVNQGRHHIT